MEAATPKPHHGFAAGRGAGSRGATRARNGHSTALFACECQSFLDSVVACFGQIGSWDDPHLPAGLSSSFLVLISAVSLLPPTPMCSQSNLLGGHGCCTLYEKSRLGALLCLDSSSFLTGYRFPMPRAKEPRGAWPLHCERHFEPTKVSGSVGAAR